MPDTPELRRIVYVFPNDQARGLFESLAALLVQDPSCRRERDQLELLPAYPPGALPRTAVTLAGVAFPLLRFEDVPGEPLVLELEALALPAAGSPTLDLSAIAGRLRGHILRVDHTGIELPSERVQRAAWDRLIARLAVRAAVYDYPEGQQWPFILPATPDERQTEIARFAAPRTPKFELTYGYVPSPLIQFHCDTRLDRAALEALFPAPHGFALPGVETFRSVFATSPWPGLDFRLDLTFWQGEGLSEWDSGEWLVKTGGRRTA